MAAGSSTPISIDLEAALVAGPVTVGAKRRTRRPLTPQALDVLKAWLMMPGHVDHPYPTDAEKALLATRAGTRAHITHFQVPP